MRRDLLAIATFVLASLCCEAIASTEADRTRRRDAFFAFTMTRHFLEERAILKTTFLRERLVYRRPAT